MFRKLKLSEIGTIVAGGTPKTKVSEYWNGEISWITPKDLSSHNCMYISKGDRSITEDGLKNSSAKLLPKGAVLFTSRAPIGYIAIAENEVTTNQGFKSIVVNNKNDNIFVYYLLKNNVNVIENLASGSTFKEISGKVMKNLEFNFPSLREQNSIAKVLKSLDDKIETNNKINNTLENMVQSIFKQWFIDFEFPNEVGDPYRLSGGEMVESKLGMIPKGWEVGLLPDLVTVKYGKDHKKLSEGDIPVYGSGGVMRYVDKALYTLETVLIPRKGTLNNVLYINEPFWSVDTMFYTEMIYPNIAKYFYCYMKTKDLLSMNNGSAVPSMTTAILNKFLIIKSPLEIIQRFNELVGPLFLKMDSNVNENNMLAKTRDSLLPKLMSGEIRVPLDSEGEASWNSELEHQA